MKKRIVGICVTVFIIASIFACWYVNENYLDIRKGKTTQLQLEMSIEKTVFVAGEPINITVSLINHGDKSINVSGLIAIPIDQVIGFRLKISDGYYLELWDPIIEENITVLPPSGITLMSGDKVNITLNLCRYLWKNASLGISRYTLNETGEYFIQAVYISHSYDISVWEGTLTSNSVAFTITEGL